MPPTGPHRPTDEAALTSKDDWQHDARCRSHGADLFFASDGEPSAERAARQARARAVCHECPVRRACLETALSLHVDHGIWGGLDERERRRLRRLA